MEALTFLVIFIIDADVMQLKVINSFLVQSKKENKNCRSWTFCKESNKEISKETQATSSSRWWIP